MDEESVKRTFKKVNIDLDRPVNPVQNYKHHKVGDFVCESEVEQDGKIICCLHNPITGDWKWPDKGDSN